MEGYNMKKRIRELILLLFSAAVIFRVVALFVMLSQYTVFANLETYNMFSYVKLGEEFTYF